MTFASYDFEHWTQASALGFRRDNLPPRQVMHNWNTAEEVHMGTSCWDRGNVIVGVELVDERFRPIAAHSGSDAAVIGSDGLDVPVRWPAGATVPARVGPYRVKLDFRGIRAEDARLYAAYVRDA